MLYTDIIYYTYMGFVRAMERIKKSKNRIFFLVLCVVLVAFTMFFLCGFHSVLLDTSAHNGGYMQSPSAHGNAAVSHRYSLVKALDSEKAAESEFDMRKITLLFVVTGTLILSAFAVLYIFSEGKYSTNYSNPIMSGVKL